METFKRDFFKGNFFEIVDKIGNNLMTIMSLDFTLSTYFLQKNKYKCS
jgi:hypothetical protein